MEQKERSRGFTLIELLVVIAIIAVLMAILMPSLRRAKQQAAAMNCLANAKTLSLAWYVYMGENDGRVVSARMDGRDGRGAMVGWIGTPRNASGQTLSNNQTSPPVEDEDEIRGIKYGKLYTYVEDPGAYHCPADNIRISVYDNTRIFTTYALAACLFDEPKPSGPMYNKQIKKFNTIKVPAEKYNFVEAAEPRNWNMAGHFVLGSPEYTNSNLWQWWGPMAVNHGDASVLGFCDGHAEKHKWRDRFTIERPSVIQAGGRSTYGRESPPDGQYLDLEYVARGWAYRHKL